MYLSRVHHLFISLFFCLSFVCMYKCFSVIASCCLLYLSIGICTVLFHLFIHFSFAFLVCGYSIIHSFLPFFLPPLPPFFPPSPPPSLPAPSLLPSFVPWFARSFVKLVLHYKRVTRTKFWTEAMACERRAWACGRCRRCRVWTTYIRGSGHGKRALSTQEPGMLLFLLECPAQICLISRKHSLTPELHFFVHIQKTCPFDDGRWDLVATIVVISGAPTSM